LLQIGFQHGHNFLFIIDYEDFFSHFYHGTILPDS
jgi:hypothetical protein